MKTCQYTNSVRDPFLHKKNITKYPFFKTNFTFKQNIFTQKPQINKHVIT